MAAAGLASVAMNNSVDHDIARHFARYPTFHGFGDEAINVLGSPATHLPAAALWYVLSARDQDEVNQQRALTMLSALTLGGTVTVGLKYIRNNDRPNGKTLAWPSGHTCSSFTVASVLHESYGLKVGIPAYLGASVVAWRMMDVGDHWASDVVFGATLGLVVGHTVARHDRSLDVAGFQVMPYYGGPETAVTGVNFLRRF